MSVKIERENVACIEAVFSTIALYNRNYGEILSYMRVNEGIETSTAIRKRSMEILVNMVQATVTEIEQTGYMVEKVERALRCMSPLKFVQLLEEVYSQVPAKQVKEEVA